MYTVSSAMKQHGFQDKYNQTFFYSCDSKKYFILPLYRIEELSNLRKKEEDYSSPALFLISGVNENPYKSNDNKLMKEFFGNPEFGNIKQAIFLAEINNLDWQNKNILDITQVSFWLNLIKIVKGDSIKPLIKKHAKYRKSYYHSFIDYYICSYKYHDFCGYEHHHDIDVRKNQACKNLFKEAEIVYCKLNNIDYIDLRHRTETELFRAPIPFPLYDLIDAEEEIKKELQHSVDSKKINLLLIDNHAQSKFIEDNNSLIEPGYLCSLIKEFDLYELFEIQMLGNTIYKNGHFYNKHEHTVSHDFFKNEFEEFNYYWFKHHDCDFNNEEKVDTDDFPTWKKKYFDLKGYHKKYFDSYANSGLTINKYSDLITLKIKSSHFVLLDFFLNTDNTYLAFDFIRDVSNIMRTQGDVSTTWYFITSAVYDSVMKYSQSGLLAEYYESAIVNAGDDPTNKKRQIIFLYKLLTFIRSRIRSFKNIKNAITRSYLFKNCSSQNRGSGDPGTCKRWKSCLENIDSICQKYLAEYDEVTAIFPRLEEECFKEIVLLIQAIIRQFFWLPEADWVMIQRQIELLDERLKKWHKKNVDNKTQHIPKDLKFSCPHIINELKKRSEIY